MTPVQLPEVPAIERYTVSGDIAYPIHEDADGDYVSYDDHAAQLREYATEAVMAERRRVLAGVQAAVDSITVPKMTPARAEYWKAGVRYAIRAFNSAITPSETNSER